MPIAIVRDYRHTPPTAQGAAVAVGNFDGLHRGHKQVIAATKAVALAQQIPCAVMSFYPHPRHFFAPGQAAIRLMRLREKIIVLQHWGVDVLYLVHFTQAFSQLTPEAFARQMLRQHIGARHVVTGEDFLYGYKRQGTVHHLKADAEALGMGFTAVPEVLVEGERCSSTAIRAALADGQLERANRLLGHPFTIAGPVRHGEKRGRTLGFPTANLDVRRLWTPAFGVYAVTATLHPGTAQAVTYQGVANLGLRPTFNGTEPLLEAHLFGLQEEIYGQRIAVALHHRLRGEESFSGPQALSEQIARDIARAYQYFDALPRQLWDHDDSTDF